MNQKLIDQLQHCWLLGHVPLLPGRVPLVESRCLNVGSGERPIHGAVNLDPNPDREKYVNVRADTLELPFPDETFHVVLSNHVLQAVRDPVQALREMARVLKPGHKMAHVIPDHRFAPLKRDKRFPFQYMWNEWQGPHAFIPLLKQVRDLLSPIEIAGFKDFRWSFKVVLLRV